MKSLLVFDLDGTMVDTATDLIAALNATLAEKDLSPIPTSEVGYLVGAGGRVMIERGLKYHGREVSADELDHLQARFVHHYSSNMPGQSAPFPGLLAALDRFAAAGWHFAVCTNKLEGLSRQLLGGLNLDGRLEAICGGDTFLFRKPDARHLLGTIDAAGGDKSRAVMIGDSRADIEAAKNAGIPVVAVTFGYTDTPVSELGPDRVIAHFDALWEAVAEVLPAHGATHA